MAAEYDALPDADSVLAVRDELIAREPLFHRPEIAATRDGFDAMMAEGFWEIGASGQCYSREFVLDTLAQRHWHEHHDQWQTSDFHCRQLAPNVYLLTYTLRQLARVTRRSTLWENSTGMWKVLFHQGTPVSEANG